MPRRLRLRSRRALITGLVLVVALAGGLFAFMKHRGRNQGVTVQTEEVSRGEVVEVVAATGRVQPQTEVKISANVSGRIELGGRLLAGPVTFRTGSHEALTWQRLIDDRITSGAGVPVAEVGQRLAEAGAERAEISNLAARHIHALRARLSNSSAIVTANRAYALDPAVTVGRIRRRPRAHLRQPPVSPATKADPPA